MGYSAFFGVLYHRGENEDSNHVTAGSSFFLVLLHFLFSHSPLSRIHVPEFPGKPALRLDYGGGCLP